MTNARAFVDTNVLLRATVVSLPLHAQARQLIENYLDADVELWIRLVKL